MTTLSKGGALSLINGELADQVDSTERALSYGDGLFETIRLDNAVPLLWQAHIDRLLQGCQRLKINYPDNLAAALLSDIEKLQTLTGCINGAIKLTLSRGAGPRGYKFSADLLPTRIVSLQSAPSFVQHQRSGVALICCETALARQPLLSGLKHLNRLEQVMARSEWQDPAIFEGVVCDTAGYVIEGTMSNLFWFKAGVWYTPDLRWAGVAGVLRQTLLNIEQAKPVVQGEFVLADLLSAEQVFICNSLIDIVPVHTIHCADKVYRFELEGVVAQWQHLLHQIYLQEF